MKNFKFILTLLLTIGLGYSATAQTAAEVKKKFNEAAAKYNAKDYAAAVPLFEATLALADKSPDDVLDTYESAQSLLINSYYSAGVAEARAGKFDAALVLFNKCSELGSLTSNSKANSAKAMIGNVYIAKGTVAAKAGNAAEAATQFNTGYMLNKRNTKLGLLAAQYYSESGNMSAAATIYKEIILLGETHSKYASAATSAKNAFSSYYLSLAIEATKANKYAEVLTNIDSILVVDPANAQGLLVRVQAANNMKKTSDVIKYAPEALAAQTDLATKANINFFLGAAYQTKEDKAKAIAAYKLVTSGPNAASAKELAIALAK